MGVRCFVNISHLAIYATLLYPNFEYEKGKKARLAPKLYQAGTLDYKEDLSLSS